MADLLVDATVTVRLEELDVEVDNVAVVLDVCDVLVLDERVSLVLIVTLVSVTEIV